MGTKYHGAKFEQVQESRFLSWRVDATGPVQVMLQASGSAENIGLMNDEWGWNTLIWYDYDAAKFADERAKVAGLNNSTDLVYDFVDDYPPTADQPQYFNSQPGEYFQPRINTWEKIEASGVRFVLPEPGQYKLMINIPSLLQHQTSGYMKIRLVVDGTNAAVPKSERYVHRYYTFTSHDQQVQHNDLFSWMYTAVKPEIIHIQSWQNCYSTNDIGDCGWRTGPHGLIEVVTFPVGEMSGLSQLISGANNQNFPKNKWTSMWKSLDCVRNCMRFDLPDDGNYVLSANIRIYAHASYEGYGAIRVRCDDFGRHIDTSKTDRFVYYQDGKTDDFTSHMYYTGHFVWHLDVAL